MNNERYTMLRDKLHAGFVDGIDPTTMAHRLRTLDVTAEEAAELIGRLLREGELGKLQESPQDHNKRTDYEQLCPIHTTSGRKL